MYICTTMLHVCRAMYMYKYTKAVRIVCLRGDQQCKIHRSTANTGLLIQALPYTYTFKPIATHTEHEYTHQF